MTDQISHFLPYGIVLAALGMLLTRNPVTTALLLLLQTGFLYFFLYKKYQIPIWTNLVFIFLFSVQAVIFTANFYIRKSFRQHNNHIPSTIILSGIIAILYFLFNHHKIQEEILNLSILAPDKLDLELTSLIIIFFNFIVISISNIFILSNKELD